MKRKKPKPLAILTDDERLDYAQRMAILNTKKIEIAACAEYFDALGEIFKEKYDLPSAYNLNLQTGEITAMEMEVPNA